INSGFQMNTHCIGDSAVSMICSIYQKEINKRLELESQIPSVVKTRWRIEHFQVITPSDLLYLDTKNSYIIPSVQPTHATSDMYWAKDRLGPERIKYAYAYNDLLKAAGMLALGTDFPVEDINPMYTFYAAVARKDLKGYPDGGFQPENALSRENTLCGMTIWGAYANFEEKEKGSIEAGKFADFVILDYDIMKCEIDQVPKTKVVYTFVNGEKVFEKK
ncbi:MAG: amidohydrolase, partial [Bacteroidia bacterium]